MSNNADVRNVIDRARAFLGLSLEDAQHALGPDAGVVRRDEYGRLHNVTSLESENVFPGTLYAEADEIRLVRVTRNGLRDITRTAMCSQMSTDPMQLRSRAGKRAQLLAYASEGIAFSTQGEDIHFLEVFTPCTHREYEIRFYRPPSRFIR